MGKKSDEIERQIAEQRARIDQRMGNLQTRIKQDVESVRSEAANRGSGAVQSTKSLFSEDGPMQEHPLTMMAGALGVGVVLGMLSEGITTSGGDGDGSRSQFYGRNGNKQSSDSGIVGSLLGTVIGPAAMTAQAELQELVREGFSTLRSKATGNGHSGDVMRENRDVGVE